MKRAITLGLTLLLLLTAATTAEAAGILLPRNGGKPIDLESHRVTAVVTDGVARTKVRQTFVNRNAARLGRVGTTAVACLCLEVYGRYGRIFSRRSR